MLNVPHLQQHWIDPHCQFDCNGEPLGQCYPADRAERKADIAEARQYRRNRRVCRVIIYLASIALWIGLILLAGTALACMGVIR